MALGLGRQIMSVVPCSINIVRGHSSWSQTYYRPENYQNTTEQQLRIMAVPSIGNRPDSIQAK